MFLFSERTETDRCHAIFLKWISSADSRPRKQMESNPPPIADQRRMLRLTDSTLKVPLISLSALLNGKFLSLMVTCRFYGTTRAWKRGLLGLITTLAWLIDGRAPTPEIDGNVPGPVLCVFTVNLPSQPELYYCPASFHRFS